MIDLVRKAEIIVVIREGGFGHTITAPDAARRFFKGKKILFLIFSEPARHNPKIGLIWPDVEFVFVPVFPIARTAIVKMVEWYVKRNASCCERFLTSMELYREIGAKHDVNDWPLHYFELLRQVPVLNLRLPDQYRSDISRKLKDLNISFKKRCCLYLRQRHNLNDITSSRRDGSSLECYVPVIDKLNEKGYQVLLVGDVVRQDEVAIQKGGLVEAKDIQLDPNLFYLFAATESDIFVGETGGGTWLSGINQIPRLCVNTFPFGYGQPRSWILYKTVYGQDGKRIPLDVLLTQYIGEYEFPGMEVRSNTSDEILNAFQRFMDEVDQNQHPEHDKLWNLIPEHTWLKQSHAQLISR